MRRYLALVAALSILALAGTAAAALRGMPPQFPKLGGKWSHAEINVKIRSHWHTVILDHGQVTQATPTELTLREFDGTTAVVAMDGRTILNGPGGYPRRGLYVETMRIDGGPAVRIRVTLRP